MTYRGDDGPFTQLEKRVEKLERRDRRAPVWGGLVVMMRWLVRWVGLVVGGTLMAGLAGWAAYSCDASIAAEYHRRCRRLCEVHSARVEWVDSDGCEPAPALCVCSKDGELLRFYATSGGPVQ